MPTTNTATKVAYKAESAYASGNGSTIHAMTAFGAGDVASLTVMNDPAEDVKGGFPKVDRFSFHPVGKGTNYKVVWIKGIKYDTFEYTHYIQNSTWMSAAIQGSNGSIPTSYAFHFETMGVAGAADAFDVFGCVLVEYKLILNTKEDYPTEKLTFIYYGMKDSVAVTSLDTVDLTQPSVHNDCTLSLDGHSMEGLATSTTLTIKNNLLGESEPNVAASYYRIDPYMNDRDIDLEVDFITDSASILGDTLFNNGTATALRNLTGIISNGKAALTLTNLYSDEDNVGEIPKTLDFYKPHILLKSGGDVVLSVA